MIIKKSEGKKRSIKGIDFELLAMGENSMVTKMNYMEGDKVPFHNHPNEQVGYVVSGEIRIRFEDFNEILRSGDSYAIPKNVDHSVEVIKQGEVLDVFTPPRKEYI